MSIEASRDANKLIQDIELELASIRAATALRRLDDAGPKTVGRADRTDASPAEANVRVIGTVDLEAVKDEPPLRAQPAGPEEPAHSPLTAARRPTLQERLALLRDET